MKLLDSIQELKRLLAADRNHPHWSWQLRQQLFGLREELASDRVRSFDGWLTAKATSTDRTRRQIMARISVVLAKDFPDVETAHMIGTRMLHDLEHFQQRVSDLTYDSVAMEIGGSE